MSSGSTGSTYVATSNLNFIYLTYDIAATAQELETLIRNAVAENILTTAVLICPKANALYPTADEFALGATMLLPINDLNGKKLFPIFDNVHFTRFFNSPNIFDDMANAPGSSVNFSIEELPLINFMGIHLKQNPYQITLINSQRVNNPLNKEFFDTFNQYYLCFNNNNLQTPANYNQASLDEIYDLYHYKLVKGITLITSPIMSPNDIEFWSGGGGGATAFADLTDVDVVPQQTGQVVYYNTLTSKWEQAQELTVDPATRDVISVTTGLFSQVANGSVSMGSVAAEANMQGYTDINIAAVTGNVLMEAQAGTVDVLSLASTTNVQAQTGVTVQTITGNAVVSAASGNANVTGNQNANLIASNGNVSVTASVGNIVGSAQNNMQLEAQAGQLFLRGQTAAQMRATTGNMLLIAQAGNVTVQANGDLACSAQNDANFTGNNFCAVSGQNQLDLSCLTGPANLTADGTISIQSATGSIQTASDVFEIKNAGLATAITYDNGAGTFRTSIPSYEANMVADSFATKSYVDGASGSSTYVGLTDVDVTGIQDGSLAGKWDLTSGKFVAANQFNVDPTTSDITIYTGSSTVIEADVNVTVNGVTQLDLTSTSGQINISAPGDQISITTGDALVMQSTVGLVTKSDQQDFRNQANTATALSIDTTANTVRTLLPSYEASMVGSSLATKTYVDSVFAPVTNAVLDGGNNIASGNLEVGTNTNNNLHLRAFGQDKFIIQNTVGTATLTGNLPMVIRPFASASGPLVTITGGNKSTAGGVGGDLILAGGGTLGGTAVNSGNVQLQGSTGLGFLLTGSSGLLASNVAGYEALVTTPNSIPNKQFIDNLTLNSLADTTISSVALSDTLIYNGSQWVNRPAVYGMCYWTGNTTAENGGVAINLATPYKPSATATTSLFLKNMTHTTPNRLTYTGTASIIAEVTYSLASNVGNNDRSFLVYVRKNGSDVVQSRTVNVSKDTVQGSDGCNNTFLLDLALNDFIEIYVTNISAGATTLTIRELNLSVKLVDYQ